MSSIQTFNLKDFIWYAEQRTLIGFQSKLFESRKKRLRDTILIKGETHDIKFERASSNSRYHIYKPVADTPIEFLDIVLEYYGHSKR